jgi:hypothetical protein
MKEYGPMCGGNGPSERFDFVKDTGSVEATGFSPAGSLRVRR